MKNDAILNDAARLEGLMPEIARNLFTLDSDHPALEMPLGQLRACSILYAPQRVHQRLRVRVFFKVAFVIAKHDAIGRHRFR